MAPQGHTASDDLRLMEEFNSWGSYYLVPIALSAPLAVLANYIWGLTPFLKGQPLSIVLAFVGTITGLVLWALYRGPIKRSRTVTVFMLGNILAWIVIAGLVWRDGDQFNFTTWLAPIVFIAVLLKPPRLSGVLAAADSLALGFLAIAATSHILHLTGLVLLPDDGAALRLPAFVQVLGLEQRWMGPFASTSDAGPVGAFLIMYGLMRFGWRRWLLVAGGVLILLAASSWTSLYSVALGFLVALWFLPAVGPIQLTLARRWAVTGVTLLLGAIFIALTDPTFNARTPLWGDYLEAWTRFPLLGLGTNGILSNMEWFTHQHAHNYYVDILTRHGLVGFMATVPLMVFAGVMAVKAGRRGLVMLPSVLACWFASLLGETLIDWRYLGYVLMEFFLVSLIAITYLDAQRDGSTSTEKLPPAGRPDTISGGARIDR